MARIIEYDFWQEEGWPSPWAVQLSPDESRSIPELIGDFPDCIVGIDLREGGSFQIGNLDSRETAEEVIRQISAIRNRPQTG